MEGVGCCPPGPVGITGSGKQRGSRERATWVLSSLLQAKVWKALAVLYRQDGGAGGEEGLCFPLGRRPCWPWLLCPPIHITLCLALHLSRAAPRALPPRLMC